MESAAFCYIVAPAPLNLSPAYKPDTTVLCLVDKEGELEIGK